MAAFVDVETTGLDHRSDEVVELAIVLFAYDRSTGRILDIIDNYTGLRDPGRPIPKGATAVHGIRDRDVRGKRLDDRRVLSLIGQADFLVAHNASFDRAFVERLYPQVKGKFWACSMRGVPWKDMGFASRALQNLLRDHGIVPKRAHRGADDAAAALSLLAKQDANGRYYFSYLVERYESQGANLHSGAARGAETVGRRARRQEKTQRFGGGAPLRVLFLPFRLAWWVLRLPFQLISWPLSRAGRGRKAKDR
jgi:DNA polymerase-3 subunit epsilon